MSKVLRIKEISQNYKLTTRTIRFWEEKGLIEPDFRTSGKRRVYGEDVEKTIKEILNYKNQGMSLESIKELLDKKKKNKSKKKIGSEIRILVDSTASISEDLANEHDIEVIPLYVSINNKLYLDGLNINEAEFNKKMTEKKGATDIITSPPTVEDFFNHYTKLIQEGAKVIYSIHISSIFSETIVNAKKAADKFSDIDIKIIDSKTSGQALAMLAICLQEKIQAGASMEACDSYLAELIDNNYLVVTLTSLKSLISLGLLNVNIDSSFGDLISRLLSFRPVLLAENGEAKFKLLSRAESIEDALSTMESSLQNQIKNSKLKLKMIGISHSKLNVQAEVFKEKFGAQCPVILQKGSVVLCAHLGPESMGVNLLFAQN